MYDPETITIMKGVLEDAWSQISVEEQRRITKTDVATRILNAAANGERDPALLRERALARAA